MGLFDDIGSALEGFGAAKDDLVNQASDQLGEVVPEEVQNIGDSVQSPGENENEQDQE